MSPSLAKHCRSLDEYRLELRCARYAALLHQHEAEVSGCDAAAAHHAREIARIDARLREIEAADNAH